MHCKKRQGSNGVATYSFGLTNVFLLKTNDHDDLERSGRENWPKLTQELLVGGQLCDDMSALFSVKLLKFVLINLWSYLLATYQCGDSVKLKRQAKYLSFIQWLKLNKRREHMQEHPSPPLCNIILNFL